MPEPAKYLLIAIALGVASELVARVLRIWVYRNVASPILNVLLMFGVVQGVGVGWLIGAHLPVISMAPVLLMTGAVIGITYEGLNEFRLHSWSWPETSLFGLTRPIDKVALVGVAWGFVPVITQAIAHLPALTGRGA